MARKRPTIKLSVIDQADSVPDLPENAPAASPAAPKRSYDGIHRSMLYLPKPVHRTIRQIAFTHEKKEHDIFMEGIDMVLKAYGMASIADLKREQ